MAKTSGIGRDELILELMERGIEIEDAHQPLDKSTRKAVKAVIRSMRGGAVIVRADADVTAAPCIEPSRRSSALTGMLTVSEVIFIHETLVKEFANTDDPIFPPGIKSMDLLESAVNRQWSGFDDSLKYHDPTLNAATLLYGICCDHAFHNGNKRTALVATLAHLDRNHLVLRDTKQKDLLRLLIDVADHALVRTTMKIGRERERLPRRGTPDEEVLAVAEWLNARTAKLTRGETLITYRELRAILKSHGYVEKTHKNHKVTICREPVQKARIFKPPPPKAVLTIDWPGDSKTVSFRQIKYIRQKLRLCEEDGVTRDAFYGDGVRVDSFINEYRTVLRKLATR